MHGATAKGCNGDGLPCMRESKRDRARKRRRSRAAPASSAICIVTAALEDVRGTSGRAEPVPAPVTSELSTTDTLLTSCPPRPLPTAALDDVSSASARAASEPALVASELSTANTLLASAAALRKARFVRDVTSYMQVGRRVTRLAVGCGAGMPAAGQWWSPRQVAAQGVPCCTLPAAGAQPNAR